MTFAEQWSQLTEMADLEELGYEGKGPALLDGEETYIIYFEDGSAIVGDGPFAGEVLSPEEYASLSLRLEWLS